jgi:23S rRNA (uracil1939-C5)-methyltransferase
MSDKPIKPLQFGQETDLVIESLAFGGEGVAHMEGFAVFVPGALPGERVRVTAREVKDRWARAELKTVLEASPHRVPPPCPIFSECGGCQWQHFDSAGQLTAKRQAVVDSLERIGRLPGIQIEPCLPSPQPYGYRNKALPVVSMRGGHFVAGIYEPRSHSLVPYHTCPIQTDAINQLVQKALGKIEQAGLTPYQPKSHTGFFRHLVVRHGLGTGEMLLAFVTREAQSTERLTRPTVVMEASDKVLPRIAAELMAEVPGLVGVLQNINTARTNIVLGPETRVLAGATHFRESFDGLTLRVSLHSFLQVNTAQAARLHEVVRGALGKAPDGKKWGTVLDLYCGIGTLALAVSSLADYVLGVEEVGPAVEDARENARLNQKKNLDFVQGDAAETLVGLKAQGLTQVDAVILDPPRKGVPPELLARLAAMGPERLVYVSCDPSTLARDLALLSKHGYKVDWIQPLDMFPQTYHVESVARLTRTTPMPPEPDTSLESRKVFRLPPEGLSPATPKGRSFSGSASFLRSMKKRLSEGAAKVAGGRRAGPPSKAPVFPPETTAEVSAAPYVPPPVLPSPTKKISSPNQTFFARSRKNIKAALWILALLGAGYAGWATLRPGMGGAVLSQKPTSVDLMPELPKGVVKRYEILTFAIQRGRDAKNFRGPWSALAQVYRAGRLVETLGKQTLVRLHAEPGNCRLVGHWPIPYNPIPGTYQVRLTVLWQQPKKAETFESVFTILPLAPHLLPVGFAALTFEGGQKMESGRVPPLVGDGPEAYRHVVDWTRFMGADALVFLGAQTSVWGDVHKKEFPFDPSALETADRYGRALHDAGLQLGVYMTTFRVVGDQWSKAPYHFATGYNRSKDELEPIDFVSLYDRSRQDHIVELLERLQKDDAVDSIGFDYLRTGSGGYEMTREFVKDLDIPVPAEFEAWTAEEQSLWLARRIERDKNMDLTHRFEWWRAHKVALTLKDMLERAKVTKPVFAFTLGWEMGHQHGQDPSMDVDAGVGVNHIMLYQRGPEQVREMKGHWPPYLDRGNSMYVLGEMVDFNWVQKTIRPAGPEELFNRETETFENWIPHNASLGMYWHDLYRLLHGAKGPYTTMEWAVAGGKAFTWMRQAEDVTPMLTRIDAPREVPAGMPFTFSVDILNRSADDLEDLSLVQLDPTSQTYVETARTGPFNLPAGHRIRVSNLKGMTPPEDSPERDNRWMLAVVVEKKGSREERAFDFAYVKALTSEETKERLDVVKAFQEKSEAAAAATPILSKPRLDPKSRTAVNSSETTGIVLAPRKRNAGKALVVPPTPVPTLAVGQAEMPKP